MCKTIKCLIRQLIYLMSRVCLTGMEEVVCNRVHESFLHSRSLRWINPDRLKAQINPLKRIEGTLKNANAHEKVYLQERYFCAVGEIETMFKIRENNMEIAGERIKINRKMEAKKMIIVNATKLRNQNTDDKNEAFKQKV